VDGRRRRETGNNLRPDRRDRLGRVENPVHVNDFHATMLHLFGFDHLRLNHDFKGLSVRLTDQGGKVVKDLMA
jgi:hypothetical protein